MDWFVKIEERANHLNSSEKWIVKGWYGEEHAAYRRAETAWEQKRAQGYKDNPEPPSNNLTLMHDEFCHNVDAPYWYLHVDGSWSKSLRQNREHPMIASGIFSSKERAEAMLAHVSSLGHKPAKFENYQEHLDGAPDPVSCKKDWWK